VKVQPTNISIEMTPREARILVAFIDAFGEEDQYGAVSDRLKIDIGEVCETMNKLERGLKSTLGDYA